MLAARPGLALKEDVIRSALQASDPDVDPNFAMAHQCAAQHGLHLEYLRRINCPKALFDEHEGAFLVSLEIRTATGSDRHYIAYLAATGHVLDNEAGGKVPVVDEFDHSKNKRGMKVFKQLFPRATSIFLKAVSKVS